MQSVSRPEGSVMAIFNPQSSAVCSLTLANFRLPEIITAPILVLNALGTWPLLATMTKNVGEIESTIDAIMRVSCDSRRPNVFMAILQPWLSFTFIQNYIWRGDRFYHPKSVSLER